MADCSFYADVMFLCVIHSSQHTQYLEEDYGHLHTWVWFLGGWVETNLPRNLSSFIFWALWHIGYQDLLQISSLRTLSSFGLYQWKGWNICAFFLILEPYIATFSTSTWRLTARETVACTLTTYFKFPSLVIFTVMLHNFYPHPKVQVYSMMQHRFSSS